LEKRGEGRPKSLLPGRRLRYRKSSFHQWLEAFEQAPRPARKRRRRSDLLQLLDRLSPTIAELTQAIQQEAEKRPEARRLMTHPGVGALTALAFVLIIGQAERFSLRQAGGELPGTRAAGKIQRESTAIGSHHETGEFDVALSSGGSGTSYCAQRSQLAEQIFSFADAPRPKNRQGGDGPAIGDLLVLDVAPATGLRAVSQVRFARGRARKSR
jgi:hypothetical protein